jgi:FAD/FMN-containing dehydrogenase
MRVCAEHSAPLVPQGGNTGLCGGATPDHSGRAVVLLTSRLNCVRAVDTLNDTMTVEAGCILQAVQEQAAVAGQFLPLSLGAEGSCTIGGNLATNAGGTGMLRYGNMGDFTLGLEAVRADGEIWDGLRGLRRDNTGYDLRNLYIGSEGNLGIITAATIKFFRNPRRLVQRCWRCPAPSKPLRSWCESPSHRFPCPHWSAQTDNGLSAFASRRPSSVSR